MGALLDVDTAVLEFRKNVCAPAPLTFPEIKPGYRAGWSLASSVIVHELVVFGVLLLSLIPLHIGPPTATQMSEVLHLSPADKIVYLPTIGGGSEGNRQGSRQDRALPRTAAPVLGGKGFNYPGPQPVVSDPPNALNASQTLLQPALKTLSILRKFVPLPNMVEMAKAEPAPTREVIIVKSSPLAVPPPSAPILKADAPKLSLPASTASIPTLSTPEALPTLAKPAERPAPPQIVELPNMPARGRATKTLVALSPIPAPPDLPMNLPAGEARGQFAISLEPTVAAPRAAPGASSAGVGSQIAGLGNRSDDSAADAASVRAGTFGIGAGAPLALANAGGAIRETGKVHESGEGGTKINAGQGLGSGIGVGTGAATSSGSGAGAGRGAGTGGFSGITIQGGRYGNSGGADLRPSIQPSMSYAMTIVSTARSGGGLADYGVFSNEKVYTVFLNMKESPADPSPSWTLQYAVVEELSGDFGARSENQKNVLPPVPLVKPMPQIPALLLHKYPRSQVVISAILDRQGRLEQMSVKQTPDIGLVPSILAALGHWAFKPAEIDGQRVAIRVLLGIPLL
jgi:hypothetical protein